MGERAVRSIGRRKYYRGRRFSIPSINHYKIPIQEEKRDRGNTIAQRTDSRMQRKGKKTKLRAKLGRPPLLLAAAAAEHASQFLHKTGLFGRLLPWLGSRAAGGSCAVLGQVLLAMLKLRLCRRSLRGCKLTHALPLDLRVTVHVLSWASSGLSTCRSRLGKRLV